MRCYPVAYVGLIVAPHALALLWAVVLGVALATFPIVLVLIGLRTRTPGGTAALSGFTQSPGYLMAAVGPFGVGVLHEASDGWTVPLLVLIALSLPLFSSRCTSAGRPPSRTSSALTAPPTRNGERDDDAVDASGRGLPSRHRRPSRRPAAEVPDRTAGVPRLPRRRAQPTDPPPSKTNRGSALGLAIFGCSLVTWIVGIVLAINVLVESSRDRRGRGKGMAIAALVMVAGGVVMALFGLASNADRDSDGTGTLRRDGDSTGRLG